MRKQTFLRYRVLIFGLTLVLTDRGLSSSNVEQLASTVTETSFHQVFFEVFSQNAESLSKLKLPVLPVPDWSSPYLSAYAIEVDNTYRVGFLGGLARASGMTDEGVALITCHELGHLLAGPPNFRNPIFDQLSAEGQADYFASSVCLKAYFLANGHTLDELFKVQDPDALKICTNAFHSPRDRAVCLRTVKGAISFTKALAIMQPQMSSLPKPSLATPDLSQVTETILDGYPSHQCRLDTLIAGATNQGRPKCWYKRP